jgi:hypothetical protein
MRHCQLWELGTAKNNFCNLTYKWSNIDDSARHPSRRCVHSYATLYRVVGAGTEGRTLQCFGLRFALNPKHPRLLRSSRGDRSYARRVLRRDTGSVKSSVLN